MVNYKRLKKNIAENTNKWKHIPFSCIGILKLSVLPKAIHRFNTTKYTKDLFSRTTTNIPKTCMETQKTPNGLTTLRKSNTVGGNTLPDIKVYYKAMVIK